MALNGNHRHNTQQVIVLQPPTCLHGHTSFRSSLTSEGLLVSPVPPTGQAFRLTGASCRDQCEEFSNPIATMEANEIDVAVGVPFEIQDLLAAPHIEAIRQI